MKAAQIEAIVGDTPHTSREKGRKLHRFIVEHKLGRCLELGFAHGVGTVWMAGAVQGIGGSGVVAVDNRDALTRQPSAKQLVAAAGLTDLVELHYDEYSYTWHLHNQLDAYRRAPFDLVFIDGAHSWDVDGFAFYLAAQILRPGGWMLFDDLDWSYGASPTLRDTAMVKAMSLARRNTPQVRSVWERLVLTDPRFGNFVEDGDWGWAQRLDGDAPRSAEVKIVRGSVLGAVASRAKRWWRQR